MTDDVKEALRESFLAERHREAGARFQELRGARVARHFGDPAEEYGAARRGVAVVDRSHRCRLRIGGRAPRRMLDGILTCTIPEGGEASGPEVERGRGFYGLALTPKGKIVTDLRVFPAPAGDDDEEAFLLDVPAAGVGPFGDHLDRYLPPRFASRTDRSGETGTLTFLGPDAASLLARDAAGLRVGEEELESLDEDEFLRVGGGPDDGVLLARSGQVDTPAFDVFADRPTLRGLRERALEAGARNAGYGAWDALRVEKGRPAFGADMDDSTIPVEAGVHRRAIDYQKGCYTGQEVIVRIRDRGRVNRHLRGLLLGEGAAPESGVELFDGDGDRPVGRVTTAVESPRFGQVAGLGYVRREVEPPADLHLGEPGGRSVAVRAVDEGGWSDEGEAPEG